MVVDICCFNGEFDLLEIRLNVLNQYVDEFIVVEFDKTFSGKDKPFYLLDQLDRYKKFGSKLVYYRINESQYEKYRELAESSPNTVGADHWKREFMQKESIKDCLTHLNDNDIVYIGDCDEIWQPPIYNYDTVYKKKLRVYSYWLNNRSSEEFWGTIVGYYKDIKNECLNHLRANAKRELLVGGWHFTSIGGYDEVKRKLSDSYTRESYWTEDVENNLQKRLEENKDFLGRGFTYTQDESELPLYLHENKVKYKHLFL